MKRFLVFVSVILLSSQSKVLNISNSNNEPLSMNRVDIDFIMTTRGENIIPTSTSLGQLEDYYNIEPDVYTAISNCLMSVAKNELPSNLEKSFVFLYKNYYENGLLKELGKAIQWNIGMGYSTSKTSVYKVELIYQSNVASGEIFLIKDKTWIISDIQLNKKEKESFDPLTPFILY